MFGIGDPELGVIMLGMFVIFIMFGFPIAFTLMALGVFFGYFAMGDLIFQLLVQRTYSVMINEVLISIPLFVFMGYIIERANILDRLFRSLQLAAGPVPASLALATLATCAIFATATGIVGATVTLMGLLAFPAMLRAGYDVKLAAGVVCAGGCLGILIPPSVMLILYGATAGVSVVKLYAGAFFPGIMLASLYMLYTILMTVLHPQLAPQLPPEERNVPIATVFWALLTSFAPLALLIGAALGSPTLDFWGVFYMAHGVGMSAVHTRREGGELLRALAPFDATRPTVVAVPADEATGFAAAAREAGLELTDLRALLAVGRSLSTGEREQIGDGLMEAGAAKARIAAAYGVGEGRILWGECAVPAGKTETFGFHTYPDLEVLEILSPETGEPLPDETPGEITITPLGFRGGGVPRWRSGDLALGGLTHRPCPNCGRTLARVGPSVRRGAWQHRVRLNGRPVRFDFRYAAASTAPRAVEWQIELVEKGQEGELYVYLQPRSEDPSPIIELFEELERWGTPPAQIVLATDAELARRLASADGMFRRFARR